MATAYQRTALPHEGIRIKRVTNAPDGSYVFKVYEVTLRELATFKGRPHSGRRQYETEDGETFSTAEEAGLHAARILDEGGDE